MTFANETNCSLCNNSMKQNFGSIGIRNDIDYYHAMCVECGEYNISGTLRKEIENSTRTIRDLRTLGRYVRIAFQENGKPPDLNEYNAEEILQNNTLPTPKQQLDQLLTMIAHEAPEVGEYWSVKTEGRLVLLGLKDDRAFVFILNELVNAKLLENKTNNRYRITMSGWEYVEELKFKASSSRRVFMAMDFKVRKFRELVDERFRPAVEDIGLKLFVMYDETKPGVIDNLMRLEIRNARAMICDLSHSNRGANWEGGYAEGLGRPVIYTCEKTVFEGKHPEFERPHFDTNHLQTIPWTASTIDDDMKKLKASLRLAIPEAIQQD